MPISRLGLLRAHSYMEIWKTRHIYFNDPGAGRDSQGGGEGRDASESRDTVGACPREIVGTSATRRRVKRRLGKGEQGEDVRDASQSAEEVKTSAGVREVLAGRL